MSRVWWALAVMLLVSVTHARAQTQQQIASCENKNKSYSPDLRIAACTAVIRSRRSSGQRLAWAYSDRGVAWALKKDYDRAIDDYSEAIAFDPRDVLAYANRGRTFERMKAYSRAVSNYSQAVRLAPDDAGYWNALCWNRAIEGANLGQAASDCDQSLRLQPNDANTLDSRGFVYFKSGDLVKATADFDAALRINPKLASSMYLRGIAKERAGDTTGGQADIGAAKALQANIAEEYASYGIEQATAAASRTVPKIRAVSGRPRAEILAGSPRLAFENPAIKGSISLRGGRFDDLALNKPEQFLLNPSGAPNAFYIEFGWLDNSGAVVAGPATMWSAEETEPLGVLHPVTLVFTNGKGLKIRRHIFIDDKYMFTIGEDIVNQSTEVIILRPYGLISRSGVSADEHANGSLVAALRGHGMQNMTYGSMINKEAAEFDDATSWIGMTSKNLTVQLWPESAEHAHVRFSSAENGASFQADYLLDPVTIKPGETKQISLNVYVGAAESAVAYHKMLGH